MKYTVKVNKVRKNEGNLRGFATVVFGESFKITNIAILENSNGNLFVSIPRYAADRCVCCWAALPKWEQGPTSRRCS